MNEKPTCKLCGELMPPGEEMFNYHGYSGPCPSPPKSQEPKDNLAAIIDPDNFSWIKVKKYIRNESASLEEQYQALEEHHVKETTFLLNKCRELAKELKDKSPHRK